MCLRAAERTGGLVWPVLYYGTGGDHALFPWTVMMPGATEIEALLTHTLRRLSDLGVAEVIVFSGHFAGPQLDMIDRIARVWNDAGLRPVVYASAVNRMDVPGFVPDHAGRFETTLLQAIAPALVETSLLSDAPDDVDRMNPASPIWGVIGADPRQGDHPMPSVVVDTLVDGLVGHFRSFAAT